MLAAYTKSVQLSSCTLLYLSTNVLLCPYSQSIRLCRLRSLSFSLVGTVRYTTKARSSYCKPPNQSHRFVQPDQEAPSTFGMYEPVGTYAVVRFRQLIFQCISRRTLLLFRRFQPSQLSLDNPDRKRRICLSTTGSLPASRSRCARADDRSCEVP